MCMNFLWIILLAFVIVVPIVFFVIYFCYSKKEEYVYDNMVSYINKISKVEIDDITAGILKAAINRVNGWNSMVYIYSSIYYSFNFWSISFSLLSVGFDCSGMIVLPRICSILAIIFLSTSLFFRFEHKWIFFKEKWSKAAVVTNDFIKQINEDSQFKSEIVEYCNKIIKIEKTIGKEDVL